MVQRHRIVITDDVDGSPAEQTIHFALDDTVYEIDLNAERSAELRAMLGLWISHARPVATLTGTKINHPAPGSNAAIRQWAAIRGIPLSPRGRIPEAIREQYATEHGAITNTTSPPH